MKKSLILAATLILMCYITSAYTSQEFSFKDLGNSDFYINDFNSYDCTTYDFTGKDLNAQIFPVLSLKAEFSPQPAEIARVFVFFNDNSLRELKHTDFKDGIARIWLPKEKFLAVNNLNICGKTSFTVNSIKISADSEIGYYSTPFFPEKDGFVLELPTYNVIVGKPFRADAVAKNYGSKDADVSLSYRKSEFEENTPEVSILTGETSSTGVVPKCREYENSECVKPGELKISYYIVANRAVPMTLLPAIMKYTNIFGEEETLLTNRPDIGALDPTHKLSAQVSLDSDTITAGDEIKVKIVVKNTSNEKVEAITVKLDSGLETIGSKEINLGSIEAGQTTDAVFTARGVSAGAYSLGCEVLYEEKSLECTKGVVKVREQGIRPELIVSGFFVLIAMAFFAYYYLKK